MQKKNSRSKKLKLKFKKRKGGWGKKGKKTPQNCKSPMQRHRFMTTINSVTEENETKEKKKLKSLIGFLIANEIDNYNRGEKKEKKKSKRIYRTS